MIPTKEQAQRFIAEVFGVRFDDVHIERHAPPKWADATITIRAAYDRDLEDTARLYLPAMGNYRFVYLGGR